MANVPSSSEPSSGTAGPGSGPAVNLSKANTRYVNFCRVTGTPEELIIDFGLQSEPGVNPHRAILAPQRIALNYLTAKRFVEVLRLTLERHESTFGNVETAIEKRMSSSFS